MCQLFFLDLHWKAFTMTAITHSEKQYTIFGETLNLPLTEDISKTKEIIMVESTLLFAKRGYEAVSIRDIANKIGIKPSSLYNHYSGKEALFDAVLDHAEDLYLLYFKRLDEAISKALTFSDVLDLMFREPIRMSNAFTCYAFSLIQTEQFRDKRSATIFNKTFLEYSINFFKTWFDKCILLKMAAPFDTSTIASIIIHTVLISINMRVHEYLNNHIPFHFEEMFTGIKQMILKLAGLES
jgi:AcrR family transcriptional regulator